jgi:hypothetical protein
MQATSTQAVPQWFTDYSCNSLPVQPDQEALVQRAEELWKHGWLHKESVINTNRGKWYAAIVRQRSLERGWISDDKVQRGTSLLA